MIDWAVTRGFFHVDASHTYATFDERIGNGRVIEPRPVALVYLGGGSKLRTVPYSPVAPIQLTADVAHKAMTLNLDTDTGKTDFELWVKPALAYEVGRLVFWKGSLIHRRSTLASDEKQRIPSNFDQSMFSRYLGLFLERSGIARWVANAVAGIFADVYMTLQTGPAAVGYAVRRAQPRRLDRFHAEDLRYQLPPLLRPYVCFRTLALAKNSYDDQIKRLNEEIWEDLVMHDVYGRHILAWQGGDRNQGEVPDNNATRAMKTPVSVTIYTETGPATIGFDAARAEVEKAVDIVYKHITANTQDAVTALAQTPDLGPWAEGNQWMHTHMVERVGGGGVKASFLAEGWFAILSSQTMINVELAFLCQIVDKATYDAVYRDQKTYWGTALYAGGWLMESPGNSGRPY
jgi:hypothetical protein